MNDAEGALVILVELTRGKMLLGHKGYGADWLSEKLGGRILRVCILPRSRKRRPVIHADRLHEKRC